MSTLPCFRDDSTGEDIEPSDEMLFLLAIGEAKKHGFDWRAILPEDQPRWARLVLGMEPKDEPGIF